MKADDFRPWKSTDVTVPRGKRDEEMGWGGWSVPGLDQELSNLKGHHPGNSAGVYRTWWQGLPHASPKLSPLAKLCFNSFSTIPVKRWRLPALSFFFLPNTNNLFQTICQRCWHTISKTAIKGAYPGMASTLPPPPPEHQLHVGSTGILSASMLRNMEWPRSDGGVVPHPRADPLPAPTLGCVPLLSPGTRPASEDVFWWFQSSLNLSAISQEVLARKLSIWTKWMTTRGKTHCLETVLPAEINTP